MPHPTCVEHVVLRALAVTGIVYAQTLALDDVPYIAKSLRGDALYNVHSYSRYPASRTHCTLADART